MICPTITRENRKRINKTRFNKPILPFTDTTQFTCDDCYAHTCCRCLCPPMEWLLGRVEVDPAEEAPSVDPSSITDTLKSVPWAANLSTRQNVAIMFFFEAIKQADIAKKLKISRQYVNRVISQFQQQLKEKPQKTGKIRL